jgi:hypothetical protein
LDGGERGGGTSEEGAILSGMCEWGRDVFDAAFVGIELEVGVAEVIVTRRF